MAYHIETAVLRAAIISASTEKVRYYLNGVLIDPEGLAVTTDGHRMFWGPLGNESDKPAAPFIIPLDVLKRVLTSNKRDVIEFSESVIDGLAYTPIDGTFPDWRRVVPAACDGQVAQFNYAYTGDISKVAKLLGAVAHIHHNGEAPAGVQFMGRPDCGCVLMPLRTTAASAAPAVWAPSVLPPVSAAPQIEQADGDTWTADYGRAKEAALPSPDGIAPQAVELEPEAAEIVEPSPTYRVEGKPLRRIKPKADKAPKAKRMARQPVEIVEVPAAEVIIDQPAPEAAPIAAAPTIWADPEPTDLAAILSARAKKAWATRQARKELQAA